MVIKLQMNHKFLLRMVVGKGTNTKAKLLSLWGLLWFAQKKNILVLQVLGDSKVIVDFANDAHQVHSLELFHRLRRVKGLLDSFPETTLQHI